MKRWTQGEVQRAMRLYRSHTAAEVATIIGRSTTAVRSMLARHQPLKEDRYKHDATVIAMHAAGATDQQIADAIGKQKAAATLIRYRLGLPALRKRGGQKKPKSPRD